MGMRSRPRRGPRTLPACNVCKAATNPRLNELQRRLAVALVPDAKWDKIREDLSPIETARWYRQMLDLKRPDGEPLYSQRSLAARLGSTQSTIANRLRLLSLPDDWQQRVIGREMSESHAMALAPWLDLPAVATDLEERLGSPRDNEDGGIPSLGTWRRWIVESVNELSVPCEKGDWFSFTRQVEGKAVYVQGRTALTERDIEKFGAELDIRDVPKLHDEGTERRAFNLDRWWELQQDRAKKSEDAAAKRSGRGEARSDDGDEGPDRAQREKERDKERREKQARITATKVHNYRTYWLQGRIAQRLIDGVPPETLTRLLLWVAAPNDSPMEGWRRQEAVRHLLKSMRIKAPKHDAAGLVEAIAAVKQPESLVPESLIAWVMQETSYGDFSPQAIDRLARL